ncbi:pectate lyase [Dickeya solani]|uniref:pectate lyase n=1 Tax=Dickeya solani TaxID=1089444 RepID=UPI001360CAF3|nr:pectate lyase [Dickeya solani]MCZ0790050.1 pectate lyase [Dickeya solani]MZH11938.1 pectate lyase [Dickeya solani]
MADISITLSIPSAGLQGGLGGVGGADRTNNNGLGSNGLSGNKSSQEGKLLEALAVILTSLLGNGGAQGNGSNPLERSNDAIGGNNSAGGADGAQGGGGLGNSQGLGGGQGQNGLGDLLTKLLDVLMPKNGAQGGQGLQGNGVNGGSGDNGGLSGAQGSGGAQGAGGAPGLEDLSKSLLQDSGESALSNGISPTQDGGGQIGDNPLLKILLALVAMLMENQKNQFGQPQDGAGGNSGGGAAPSVGGGAGGGAAPSVGGGAGGGAAPSVGGGAGGGAAPSVGGGAGGGAAPSVGGGAGGGAAPSVGGGAGGSAAPSVGGGSTPTVGGGNAASAAGDTNSTASTGSAGKAGPVSFPTADNANAIVVNEPIKVGPGEVFDGKGKTYVAGPALGDGGQKEGQKPLFEVADGGSVKNVIFGNNAADGIHLHGDAKIDNVHWTNVGEDALTVKSNTGKPANVSITNSSAQGASDKVFQLNADANFNVDNFKAKDFGTFVRTNGGQQGNWNLNLSNIDAQNGKFSFVKSDSEGLNVKVNNANLDNVNNHYKVPKSTNLQVS